MYIGEHEVADDLHSKNNNLLELGLIMKSGLLCFPNGCSMKEPIGTVVANVGVSFHNCTCFCVNLYEGVHFLNPPTSLNTVAIASSCPESL